MTARTAQWNTINNKNKFRTLHWYVNYFYERRDRKRTIIPTKTDTRWSVSFCLHEDTVETGNYIPFNRISGQQYDWYLNLRRYNLQHSKTGDSWHGHFTLDSNASLVSVHSAICSRLYAGSEFVEPKVTIEEGDFWGTEEKRRVISDRRGSWSNLNQRKTCEK